MQDGHKELHLAEIRVILSARGYFLNRQEISILTLSHSWLLEASVR